MRRRERFNHLLGEIEIVDVDEWRMQQCLQVLHKMFVLMLEHWELS
jgi:hypothetical protein